MTRARGCVVRDDEKSVQEKAPSGKERDPKSDEETQEEKTDLVIHAAARVFRGADPTKFNTLGVQLGRQHRPALLQSTANSNVSGKTQPQFETTPRQSPNRKDKATRGDQGKPEDSVTTRRTAVQWLW